MLMLHIAWWLCKIGNMKKILLVFMSVLVVYSGTNCYAEGDIPARDGNTDCPGLEIVFARGSGGEYENTREYFELKKASLEVFSYLNLTTRFSDLDYEATDVSSPLKLLRAFVSAGKAYEFGRSVREGVNGMRMHYRNISRKCPDTKWVLVGYSQGAMVMAEAVKYFAPEKVAHVLMFGDPETYLPEGKGLFPDACMRRNYSTWRRYVPNCRTYQGVFGGRDPYEAEELKYKYSLWCNDDDYICGSSRNPFRNSGHTQYADYMAKDFKNVLQRYVRNPILVAAEVPKFAFKLEEYDDRIRVSWNAAEAPEKYLLLRLNGLDLGYVEALAGEIEIRDVDWGEENKVTLLPMAEDGELSEEVEISEISDERTESPPEIVVSPAVEEPPAAESVDDPVPEPSLPEEVVAPEEVAVSEPDKQSEVPVIDSSVSDNINTSEPASDSSGAQRTEPQHNGGSLKLGTKRGLGLARGLDIAKIVFAMTAATAMLILLLIKRK